MIDETSKFFKEREFNIRYSEMDYHKVLKPSAMLNFLQDLATFAADEGGFGYNETVVHNLGWFLLKYHMEFEDYPKNLENLLIKTEARGYNKLFASRDFELYNTESKALIGRVISQWALVNMSDKSMASPAECFPFMYKVEKREDDLSFEKIHPLERVDYSEEFKVRYDDIDVNQHVNNMNYIVWAFEALPLEFRKNYKPKTIDMIYKKDIAYGNSVVSKLKIENETTHHLLVNKETEEQLCIVDVLWENL